VARSSESFGGHRRAKDVSQTMTAPEGNAFDRNSAIAEVDAKHFN